jgi:hypothetical protein
MAGSKSAVDPRDAFTAYVDMGTERSLKGLERILKDKGFAIGRSTLIRWKNDGEWDKRVLEAEAGRQLEQEAAQLATAAREKIEEAGAKPATIALDVLNTVRVTDFSEREQLAATAEKLNGLVCAMAATCMEQLGDLNALEPRELLQFVNATRDLARAAGDVHRALNPPAPKGAAAPDGPMLTVPPGALSGAMIPDDLDELEAALMNPPRLSGKL